MANVRSLKAQLGAPAQRKTAKDAKLIKLATVGRKIEAEITDSETLVQKVYTAFEDTKRKFTVGELHRTIAGLDRLEALLSKRSHTVLAGLRQGTRQDMSVTRFLGQNEEIALLRSKVAALKAIAEASLPVDDVDGEFLQVDEAGYVSEDLEDELVSEEPMVEADDESEVVAPAPAPAPAPEVIPTPEPVAASVRAGEIPPGVDPALPVPPISVDGPTPAPMDAPIKSSDETDEVAPEGAPVVEGADEELLEDQDVDLASDLELPESGIDTMAEEMLIDDDMLPVEEEVPVTSARAAIRNARVATASRQSGAVESEDVLGSIMSELLA